MISKIKPGLQNTVHNINNHLEFDLLLVIVMIIGIEMDF